MAIPNILGESTLCRLVFCNVVSTCMKETTTFILYRKLSMTTFLFFETISFVTLLAYHITNNVCTQLNHCMEISMKTHQERRPATYSIKNT
jgi:hypothetical protein